MKNFLKFLLTVYTICIIISFVVDSRIQQMVISRSGGTGRRTGLKILRWLNTVPVRFRSSAPKVYMIKMVYRGVEQLVARRAHNPKVVGSSPAPATNNMAE